MCIRDRYRAISEGDDLRAVTDFIAGMTDRYAKNLYQRLFIPNALHYYCLLYTSRCV